MRNLIESFNARESLPGNKFTGKTDVLLDGADVSRRCFGIYRYDDGMTDLHLYILKDDKLVINPAGTDVLSEVLTYHSERIEVIPVRP